MVGRILQLEVVKAGNFVFRHACGVCLIEIRKYTHVTFFLNQVNFVLKHGCSSSKGEDITLTVKSLRLNLCSNTAVYHIAA